MKLKTHFLNHNLFRLYALYSRSVSLFPGMAFFNAFCVLFCSFLSCFTCWCSLSGSVSVSPISVCTTVRNLKVPLKDLSHTFEINHWFTTVPKTGAYLEPCQRFLWSFFTVNGFGQKNTITDVWRGSIYASATVMDKIYETKSSFHWALGYNSIKFWVFSDLS